MKCPKCGFNSFEFLDNCKKCGVSLASFKKNMGVSAIVFAPDQQRTVTAQVPPVSPPLEEAAFSAPPVIQPEEENEENFTWEVPALSESAPEADSGFSGFDLDFMKDEEKPAEKPAEPDIDFSFEDEPVAASPESPATGELPEIETANAFDEFSFYENTLDPGQVPPPAADDHVAQENDVFGETGVIGEILPEQLQATDVGQEGSDIFSGSPSDPGSYENEFVFEDLAVEPDNKDNKEKETKKDPLDISDFEKDFESIFLTDDTPDKGKTNG